MVRSWEGVHRPNSMCIAGNVTPSPVVHKTSFLSVHLLIMNMRSTCHEYNLSADVPIPSTTRSATSTGSLGAASGVAIVSILVESNPSVKTVVACLQSV